MVEVVENVITFIFADEILNYNLLYEENIYFLSE